MNDIPVDFQFSQNNLQDYIDCPHRFELRYLLKVDWPALQTEPVLEFERRQNLGRRFHERVHQSILGIPLEQIISQKTDPEVEEWWDAYTNSALVCALPALRKPEFTLSAPFENYRLIAKFDLLAIEPGKYITIIDWKTSTRPTARANLALRMQTRVYPFLVVEAGWTLFGGVPVLPDQIEMIYWFTSAPDQVVHFPYSPKQYLADREVLSGWIHEIIACRPGQFSKTLDDKKCLYCVYRSLCDRGTSAGVRDDASLDEDPESKPDIPFDQISEVEF